jgi:hypothetical protein
VPAIRGRRTRGRARPVKYYYFVITVFSAPLVRIFLQ